MLNLDEIENTVLDGRTKGLPPGCSPFPLRELGQKGWNILREDMTLPLAILRESALDHNSRWMRGFLKDTGVQLAPHGKTTMSPQLFSRQLADGAWGLTLATIQQVQVARRFGVSRILIANQIVQRSAIQYLLAEMARDEKFECFVLVDSLTGAARLASAARAAQVGRPLSVLVEVGLDGARCGCRTLDAALAVAAAVKEHAPLLALRGVEGFEGSVSAGPTVAQTEGRVEKFLRFLLTAAEACERARLFSPGPVILSAGGSAYFDLVASSLGTAQFSQGVEVVLRSGCYLTHDSIFYRRLHERMLVRRGETRPTDSGLQPALEVWAMVQSRPEPTRAVLALGKRDCSFDLDLPAPVMWFRGGVHSSPQRLPPGHALAALNDQHALLDLPAESPLAVGDLVACGISHPCTTFDRWRLLPVVDDQYNVTSGVLTYF